MRMIGIDVGGTFTDIVSYDEQHNELRWAKAASSPANPAAGVLAAIERSDIVELEDDRIDEPGAAVELARVVVPIAEAFERTLEELAGRARARMRA